MADQQTREILIALLNSLGFTSFQENKNDLQAYILKGSVNQHYLEEKVELLAKQFKFNYSISTIQEENWNRKWEENFSTHPNR